MKGIVVTGSVSGIGLETSMLLTEQGTEVLCVDVNKRFEHVEEFHRAGLGDKRTIEVPAYVLSNGIDGIANNAGLPPTRPAKHLLAVNLVGLKHLTRSQVPKMNDNASIVNVVLLRESASPIRFRSPPSTRRRSLRSTKAAPSTRSECGRWPRLSPGPRRSAPRSTRTAK